MCRFAGSNAANLIDSENKKSRLPPAGTAVAEGAGAGAAGQRESQRGAAGAAASQAVRAAETSLRCSVDESCAEAAAAAAAAADVEEEAEDLQEDEEIDSKGGLRREALEVHLRSVLEQPRGKGLVGRGGGGQTSLARLPCCPRRGPRPAAGPEAERADRGRPVPPLPAAA